MVKNWAIALFVLIVIAAGWWWFVTYAPQPSTAPPTVQQPAVPATDTHYAAPAKLEIHHALKSGTNTYSGVLPIRACNTFSGGLSTTGSGPVHVNLSFKIFDGDGTCLASTVPENTPQPFSMSFSSKTSTSTPALDSVSINGAPVAFSVIEDK